MPVSISSSRAIYDALKEGGIRLMSALPETWLVHLVRMAQGGHFRRFPKHGIMHGAGKFGLASLCNLDRLPPTGAVVIAAPLKIVRGSGSPLRVIAIVPA